MVTKKDQRGALIAAASVLGVLDGAIILAFADHAFGLAFIFIVMLFACALFLMMHGFVLVGLVEDW